MKQWQKNGLKAGAAALLLAGACKTGIDAAKDNKGENIVRNIAITAMFTGYAAAYGSAAAKSRPIKRSHGYATTSVTTTCGGIVGASNFFMQNPISHPVVNTAAIAVAAVATPILAYNAVKEWKEERKPPGSSTPKV